MKKSWLIVLLGVCAACSGGSSAVTDTTAAVPGDVVLSSPTSSTSASIALSLSKARLGLGKATGDATGEDFLAKKEALHNLLAASGDCSFTLELPTVSDVNCYGPRINFNGHVDSVSGDGDSTDDNPNDDDGQLPVGDTGIWNANEGTQACAAAKTNELVDKVSSKVDNMVSIFGAMACAGKKANLDLPAVGSTQDLTAALSANATISGATFDTATLARLDNDADGNPVYLSTLTMTLDFGVGGTRTATIILKHIPTSTDNSTYKGKISMKLAEATTNPMNCGTLGTTGFVDAGTILYSKASSTSMKYELNFATFCGGTTDPFDTDNNIDPSNKASLSNTDGWSDNWNYGLFDINPTNGTGALAFAWQAGVNDGRTRVFDVTTAAQNDGSVTGDAYYGFGPDIATASGRGEINGFVCNWAGPNNNHTGVEKAQRQQMTSASGSSEFTADSSNIRYAITNTCETNAGGSFVYEATSHGAYEAVGSAGAHALTMDNDRATAGSAITMDLVDLTAVTFTMPTPPSDV